MPLIGTQDETSCKDFVSSMQNLTMKELGAYIATMERRYPALKGRLNVGLGGYTADENRSEWLQFIRSGQAFSARISQAAVAAQNSFAQFRTPFNRRALVRVCRASTSGAATAFAFGLNTVQVGGGGVNGQSLLIDGTGAVSSSNLASGTAAAVSGTFLVMQEIDVAQAVPCAMTPEGDFIVELGPNQFLDIWDLTVNQFMRCHLQWAEIAIAGYPVGVKQG